MRSHAMLLAIAGLALQGCSSKEASPSKDKGSGSAAKQPPAAARVVELPTVAAKVAQPVTAHAYVVLKKDGSIIVGRTPETVSTDDGLAVADLTGSPVQLTDVPARISDVYKAIAEEESKSVNLDSTDELPPLEPEEEEEDEDLESGGSGHAMVLDEGKMGKKDSDRAEGSYKMKGPVDKEQLIAEAKKRGILGSKLLEDPCSAFASLTGTGDVTSGFDDADIYGGLIGNEPGEMTGGFGFGASGFGGDGPVPAGLRGRSMMDAAQCSKNVPLVLADAGAPAAHLIELLVATTYGQLAVSTDGGAHAKVLAIDLQYLAGNTPVGETIELAFTVRPDGVKGSAYRGDKADESVWTWSGDADALAEAYAKAHEVTQLHDEKRVRIRIDGDLTAGGLVTAIATLLEAGAAQVAFGEPINFALASGHGTIGTGRRSGAPVPSVKIGQPTVTGSGDKAIIRRYIKRNLSKITYCYEKELLSKPGLEGKVETQFLYKHDGSVEAVTATGVDPEVSRCIAGVIEKIELPKIKGGGSGTVSYAFTFAPTGG